MTYREAHMIRLLRRTGSCTARAGSFEHRVEVDGPAAPPVSTGSRLFLF